MTEEKKTYKKRKIRVVIPDGPPAPGEEPTLFIDDHFQLAAFEGDTGRYWSYKLPYTDYATLVELAQALIDNDLAD